LVEGTATEALRQRIAESQRREKSDAKRLQLLARHKRAGVKSPANRKPLDFSYRVNAKPRKSRADWPTKISVWSVEPTQLSVLDLDRANQRILELVSPILTLASLLFILS